MERQWAGALVPETQRTAERVGERLGVLKSIEDVGAADTVMEIRHGLARVPRGMVVVNQEVPSGTEPAAWYRVAGDAEWDQDSIWVRWTVANAAVTVWVF